MTNRKKAFIVGIKSTKLNKKEIAFLKKYKPWGIILFSRNINSIKQTKHLTDHIRKIFKDKNYPIIIDEEGGTVTRLKKIIDTSIFSQKYFGNLYRKDKKKFGIYFSVYINQISYILKLLGININTVPVLDVLRSFSSNVLKDRCYSSNPKIVSDLGNLCIRTFEKNGIATVIKHIPGHGLSSKDTHSDLPKIKEKLSKLKKNDFYPFKNKSSCLAMTAHIIYESIDKLNTATHSKKVIKLIRNNIGYKNIIMTDDISMKALKFSLEENTIRAFTAGCNLILHCNGNIKEMTIVAKNSPFITKFIRKKNTNLNHIFG
tara:strand:- start:123 stop:1073 length:951 start_codon:yes stop_codon:yes gene_type:complete